MKLKKKTKKKLHVRCYYKNGRRRKKFRATSRTCFSISTSKVSTGLVEILFSLVSGIQKTFFNIETWIHICCANIQRKIGAYECDFWNGKYDFFFWERKQSCVFISSFFFNVVLNALQKALKTIGKKRQHSMH